MAAFPVKFIHEGLRGAPSLNRTAGSLLSVLNAFLIDGWGQATATSVTVSAGVATATFAEGITFYQRAIVFVDGATSTSAPLNGEARVLTTASNQITFATTAPAGTASGTITVKYAPVGGWEIVYTASNVAVYRSTDALSPGFCYRINDSIGSMARIVAYESMTDIDTGVGPTPKSSQVSGGGYIGKANTAAGALTPTGYTFFADSRFVAVLPQVGKSYNAAYVGAFCAGFGDYLPLSSDDVFASGVSVLGSSSDGGNSYSGASGMDRDYNTYGAPGGTFFMRSHSGVGSAVMAQKNYAECGSRPSVSGAELISGADSYFGACPSLVTGGVMVSRRVLTSDTSADPRAFVPGLLYIPQSGALGSLSHLSVVPGIGGYAGRDLVAVALSTGTGSVAPSGVALFDITGPWR